MSPQRLSKDYLAYEISFFETLLAEVKTVFQQARAAYLVEFSRLVELDIVDPKDRKVQQIFDGAKQAFLDVLTSWMKEHRDLVADGYLLGELRIKEMMLVEAENDL